MFLVGSGAIGCELLKIWASMGLGLNNNYSTASITITDMDLIEKSNLNRQLLFRSSDIQQPKSVVAGKAIGNMNSEYKTKPITALQERVCPESESILYSINYRNFWKRFFFFN